MAVSWTAASLVFGRWINDQFINTDNLKMLRKSGALLKLFFLARPAPLIVLLFSLQSFSGQDLGCFEGTSVPSSCTPNGGIISYQNTQGGRVALEKLVDDIEAPFFWDFLKDQYEQSACETDLLKNQFLLPGAELCEIGDAEKEGRQDRSTSRQKVQENQRAIYLKLKLNIGQLSGFYTQCATFKKDLARTTSINSWAQKLILGETSEANIFAGTPGFVSGAEACTKFELLANAISPIHSQPVHDFVEAWAETFSKPGLSEDAKLRELDSYAFGERRGGPAAPLDLRNPDFGRSRAKARSLDLNEMLHDTYCSARKRKEKLESHMANTPEGRRTPKPGTFVAGTPSVGNDIKEILLSDGGMAAAAFYDRQKTLKASSGWTTYSEEFKCYLKSNYFSRPQTKRKIIRITIGGIAVAVTLGMQVTTGSGWIVSSILVDLAATGYAGHEAYKVCRGESMYSIDSLQTGNVCEAKPANSASLTNSSELNLTSCTEATLRTLFAGVSAVASTAKLVNELGGTENIKIITQQALTNRAVKFGDRMFGRPLTDAELNLQAVKYYQESFKEVVDKSIPLAKNTIDDISGIATRLKTKLVGPIKNSQGQVVGFLTEEGAYFKTAQSGWTVLINPGDARQAQGIMGHFLRDSFSNGRDLRYISIPVK
jgi:hypothetical protein